MGKQKLASKQYNSPMAMYSEDVLEEIMQQVTITNNDNDNDNVQRGCAGGDHAAGLQHNDEHEYNYKQKYKYAHF